MADNKVVSLHPKTETELERFFAESLKEMRDAGRRKIMIISINDETDGVYDHTYSTLNLVSSECVGLLEITKSTILKNMNDE